LGSCIEAPCWWLTAVFQLAVRNYFALKANLYQL
jgi:hypothetical protein